MPETYILGARVFEDSRYIALSYHVSSGGYGAAFVRPSKGGYRELDGSAMEQIEKGRCACGIFRRYRQKYPLLNYPAQISKRCFQYSPFSLCSEQCAQ